MAHEGVSNTLPEGIWVYIERVESSVHRPARSSPFGAVSIVGCRTEMAESQYNIVAYREHKRPFFTVVRSLHGRQIDGRQVLRKLTEVPAHPLGVFRDVERIKVTLRYQTLICKPPPQNTDARYCLRIVRDGGSNCEGIRHGLILPDVKIRLPKLP